MSAAGIGRKRCGRGFRYVGPGARPVKDPRVLARIKALVIPPAWEDVWICPDPDGHIQAVGTDSAGRRQYRYHDLWREQRAVARVVREVADYLGDTPAVARASYIDPRVTDGYEEGRTIASVLGDLGASSDFGQLATEGRAEAAVLRLLGD